MGDPHVARNAARSERERSRRALPRAAARDSRRASVPPALHGRFPARRRAAHDSRYGYRRHASHGLVLRPVGARHGLAALHGEIRSEAARQCIPGDRQTGAAGHRDAFTAPVPLYALRIGGKPERLGVVVTTGAETRFHFESRIRPTRIVIDPNLTLLWNKS